MLMIAANEKVVREIHFPIRAVLFVAVVFA